MSRQFKYARPFLAGEVLMPGTVPPVQGADPGNSMFRPLIEWFEDNLWFRRSKSVPGVSFRYNHLSTHFGGSAVFNTGGLAVVQASTPAFGYNLFIDPSVLTRVDLTISVRDNSNNAIIGAYVLMNGPTAGTSFAPAGTTSILIQNTINNEVGIITKHFAWSPYSGYAVGANSTLSTAVIGDAAGICGVTVTYHWLANPGDIALGRH